MLAGYEYASIIRTSFSCSPGLLTLNDFEEEKQQQQRRR